MAEDKDKEWEHRVLCSDETCIGIIGPDGRCKECGLAYAGPLPLPSDQAPFADSPDQAELDAEEFEADDAADAEDDDPQWAQRTLCSDESCIGVIGADGRCKECGKPYEA